LIGDKNKEATKQWLLLFLVIGHFYDLFTILSRLNGYCC